MSPVSARMAYGEGDEPTVNRGKTLMKTRDRILAAALDLFNAEGVSGLSAVDVASAMGISAGHLYYHFKGKAELVAELVSRHRDEVDLVLTSLSEAMEVPEATLETLWTHVHILVEEAWDARFFYREPALAMGQAEVGRHARHIFHQQHAVFATAILALDQSGQLQAPAEIADGLARQMVTGVAFHTHVLEMAGDVGPPRERIARAAAQIMIPVAGLAT